MKASLWTPLTIFTRWNCVLEDPAPLRGDWWRKLARRIYARLLQSNYHAIYGVIGDALSMTAMVRLGFGSLRTVNHRLSVCVKPVPPLLCLSGSLDVMKTNCLDQKNPGPEAKSKLATSLLHGARVLPAGLLFLACKSCRKLQLLYESKQNASAFKWSSFVLTVFSHVKYHPVF